MTSQFEKWDSDAQAVRERARHHDSMAIAEMAAIAARNAAIPPRTRMLSLFDGLTPAGQILALRALEFIADTCEVRR